MSKLNKAKLMEFLKKMITIRLFEIEVEKNFIKGNLYGTAHLAIGQEAIAVGSILALDKNDLITSTHRGHGHCIAKGADIKLMMAELFGKETGYCKGRGGSMHIADLESGNLGANGIVAGGIGIATGAALAAKKLKTGQVVLCFFGEGAVNEGIFHESINMASIWNLPVLYICENNQYGMGLNIKKAMKNKNVSERAKAYKVKSLTIDGNDVVEVFENVSSIIHNIRKGSGPVFLECVTYRLRGHSIRDAQKYRSREEVKEREKSCPIKRYKDYLLKNNVISKEKINELEQEVQNEINDAVEFAIKSPLPDINKVEEDVYA